MLKKLAFIATVCLVVGLVMFVVTAPYPVVHRHLTPGHHHVSWGSIWHNEAYERSPHHGYEIVAVHKLFDGFGYSDQTHMYRIYSGGRIEREKYGQTLWILPIREFLGWTQVGELPEEYITILVTGRPKVNYTKPPEREHI